VDVLRTLNDFCDDVLTGRRVTGQLQRSAITRFKNDLKRSQEPGCEFYFDERKAAIAIRFIGLLKHTTGDFAGKPFLLEPWQIFIIANIFGWRWRSNGTRRFRNAHIEIGRKNGKTALVAAIALLCLVMDGEGRPEVYAVATKRAQSKLSWQEADRFRSGNAWLSEQIRSTPSKYIMTGADESVFVALAGDGGGDDGLNPSCVIFDELHEWKLEGHLKLWDKMRTGSSTRPHPLFITITTAGDTKSYLWKSERKYAEAVSRGEQFDDTLFAFICCLDPHDDIFDPANWIKANPGLGTIKKAKDIEDLATKARIDPTAERQLKRYHCNLMVEPTAQGITAESWERGNQPLPDLRNQICFGAVDLGWRDDLAAFWLVFPPPNLTSGVFYTLGWAFCPLNGARDLTQGEWQQWQNEGLLLATPGTETSVLEIHKIIEQARKTYKIKAIAIDPNNARQFGQELEAKQIEVVGHGQKGIHYNEPFRALKSACNEGRIIHGGNKLLTWCVGNMVVAMQGGLMRPAKEHSRDKIDPAVAMIMAWSIATLGTGKTQTKGEARVRYL
jgi:phage terminase large subunit-like protein